MNEMILFTILALFNNVLLSKKPEDTNKPLSTIDLTKENELKINNEGTTNGTEDAEKSDSNQIKHMLILAKDNSENARKLGIFERIKILFKTIFGYYVKLEQVSLNEDKDKKFEVLILKEDDKKTEGIRLGYFERFKIAFKQLFGKYLMVDSSIKNDENPKENAEIKESDPLESNNQENQDSGTTNPSLTSTSVETEKNDEDQNKTTHEGDVLGKPENDQAQLDSQDDGNPEKATGEKAELPKDFKDDDSTNKNRKKGDNLNLEEENDTNISKSDSEELSDSVSTRDKDKKSPVKTTGGKAKIEDFLNNERL